MLNRSNEPTQAFLRKTTTAPDITHLEERLLSAGLEQRSIAASRRRSELQCRRDLLDAMTALEHLRCDNPPVSPRGPRKPVLRNHVTTHHGLFIVQKIIAGPFNMRNRALPDSLREIDRRARPAQMGRRKQFESRDSMWLALIRKRRIMTVKGVLGSHRASYVESPAPAK